MLVTMPAMLFPMPTPIPIMIAIVWSRRVIIVGVSVSRRVVATRGVRVLPAHPALSTAITALDRATTAKEQKNQTNETNYRLHNPEPPAKNWHLAGGPGYGVKPGSNSNPRTGLQAAETWAAA